MAEGTHTLNSLGILAKIYDRILDPALVELSIGHFALHAIWRAVNGNAHEVSDMVSFNGLYPMGVRRKTSMFSLKRTCDNT